MRSLEWLAGLLLRAYPAEVRDAVGAEILAGIRARVLDRRRSRGRVAATLHAVRELGSLVTSGIEARNELSPGALRSALGIRLSAQGTRLATLRHDLRHSLRGLQRSPLHSGVIILLVAIGIGMGTTIFSVVDRVLVSPLPFDGADRLVHLWGDRSWQGEPRGLLADDQIRALRDGAPSFEGFSALWMVSGRILGGDRPVHTDVARTSANFFDLLGVEPMLGRTFVEGEDQPGAPWVAVLDYGYWVREFGADPNVVGRRIVVGWPEMEIIGVLPPDFDFQVPSELGSHGRPDVWIPWWHGPAPESRALGGSLAVLGKLRPGVSLQDAESELAGVAEREDRLHYGSRGFSFEVQRLKDEWVAGSRLFLLLLAGAGTLLLLIAVTNVCTLLMVRTHRRRREVALRHALGASRGRIGSLLAMEGAVLVLIGGILGLGVASLATGKSHEMCVGQDFAKILRENRHAFKWKHKA